MTAEPLKAQAIGFIVLARRPGEPPEPISAVFNGPKALEQAQNVLESCGKKHTDEWATWNGIRPPDRPELAPDPVEYIIALVTQDD